MRSHSSPRPNPLFGKSTSSSRYIPDLSATNKAREQELNDEGFEETQSLVSESLSQEASSGNYETDTHDSTRCSPAEMTRLAPSTTSGAPSQKILPTKSITATTAKSSKVLAKGAQGARSVVPDKSIARLQKTFERRDSRDSLSSGRSAKSTANDKSAASSYLPKRAASLKREPPTR